MDKVLLTVIIPVSNQEIILKNETEEICKYLQSQKISWELIISDNGSNDKSVEFISGIQKFYPTLSLIKNLPRGKSSALTNAIMLSKGYYILCLDGNDLSDMKNIIPAVIQAFKKGAEMVVIKGKGIKVKGIFNNLFNTSIRLFILKDIKYDNICSVAYSKNAISSIFPKIKIFKVGRKYVSDLGIIGLYLESIILAKKIYLNMLVLENVNTNSNFKNITLSTISKIKFLLDILLIRIFDT